MHEDRLKIKLYTVACLVEYSSLKESKLPHTSDEREIITNYTQAGGGGL